RNLTPTVTMTRTQTMTNVPIVRIIATSFQVVVANISHPQSGSTLLYAYSAAYYGNRDQGYNCRISFREGPTVIRPARLPHLPRQQQFARFRPEAARDISAVSGERRPLRRLRSCRAARRPAAVALASCPPLGML